MMKSSFKVRTFKFWKLREGMSEKKENASQNACSIVKKGKIALALFWDIFMP